MKSMTGFGKGTAEAMERRITVELRSVNHRFLDVATKFPRMLICCEDAVRKTVSKYISRGHVDVFVTYEDNRQGKAVIKPDFVAAARYIEIGEELAKMGVINDLTASAVMKLPEVLNLQSETDDENVIISLATEATVIACERLVAMRATEGEMLKADFENKLNNLECLTNEIESRAPIVAKNYADKLRLRITESLAAVEIDETRLLNEVAFFVDKANIDEEITRLKGHIAHGRAIIKEKGAIGKKLDFLVQEMNREVNTTGSKSNDLFITEKVLLAKNEVEKIREQVQNIE